ncbi:glycosyltransferase [Tumebacillus permanentifrigoris]|uniref:Cellulose synthase/poly-beta-1,6-N-acetylglucosamine synthase-like glycosyltransferase n=1 Tax=Tumebacillus permanentifrigoris TaxID=378543 RepID=A0A316D5G6_9BACL|nr:glycosyltransferase family 2 protein [Tumebacillus permanentifrigoris]PWK08450.1 cellulose synthase/poly-beta-1,6-N-acetylglucosamine synthase-like glycosyltransferase [Tumebacillus permanentifrigoris]
MTALQILAIVVAFYWVPMLGIHIWGLPKVPRLKKVLPPLADEPLVSIIVAGKEEEASIVATLESLLALQYAQLELIVVNDRSADRTGERMEAVRRRWAEERTQTEQEGSCPADSRSAGGAGVVRFEVVHIDELPAGWLGKNHALYQGYLRARGDYILFTDADVHFTPFAVRSAMAFFQALKLDHLTVSPFLVAKTFWLRAFVQFFLYSLCLLKWPWKPNDDTQHKDGFGIGAFNLLTRDAYEQVGTHRVIAMRPDDDLMLGTKIKQARLKQRMGISPELLQVEWYPSVGDAMRGLEKNMFAGLNYSLWMVLVATIGQLVFFFLPFLAMFTGGWQGWLFLVAVLCNVAIYLLYTRKMTTYSGIEVVALPLTVLLFLFIFLRSTVLTLKRGGIYWRGTFYSLQELKHPPQ